MLRSRGQQPPFTPSLSSEHLSIQFITGWIPSTFLFLLSCYTNLQTLRATLVDFSCVLNVTSHLSSWCLLVSCCITFKDQPQAFGFEPKLQYVALPMVSSFLCLNALNLASAWCLEHDFVRLRKVSRDWYRAFQYVPDEVVQTRIELQHSTYFAQMVALQWVQRWTQQDY